MKSIRRTKLGIGVGKQYSFTTSKGSPKRAYTKEDCDILALVCLPLRKIQFLPVGMVRGITKRIHKDTFNDDNITEKSWKFAVQRCLYESSRAIQQHEANLPLPIPLHFEKQYKNK